MYGERVLIAIVKEYEQLDKLNTFEPLSFKKVTSKQKAWELKAIDLIK